MSVISQGSCHKCGSSDAYTIYANGSEHCFSCGYHKNSHVKTLKGVAEALNTAPERSKYALPYDLVGEIPKEPLKWLRSYGITDDEIHKKGLKWSESRNMLVFTCEGLFWQGRYFPQRVPKVFTGGFPDDHLYIDKADKESDTIIFVEDPVSSIKVSRLVDCAPLFGSNLSVRKALAASRYYDKSILWLDADKFKTSTRLARRYDHLFKKGISTIYTDLDPKELTDKEIKNEL